ncbi:hypothetical protein BDV93DRAFT_527067 [Ceratobasidium sp. AG-I]|nr:hypothetical protein BDV93DRAFT_527067 [Ceratobasidium sp. AG-I]
MGGTKRSDRRRLCDEDCFRAKRGAEYPLAYSVALLPDDNEKRSFDYDRREETTEASPPASLALPSRPIPTPSKIASMIISASSGAPISSLFRTPSPSSTLAARLSAVSSMELPQTTSATQPYPTSNHFSASTVIALSTILPAIIIALLLIILYLLRTRRHSSDSRSRGQRPTNPDTELPLASIEHDPEALHPVPSFVALPHRAISPFNLSLLDLSQSMFFGGARLGHSKSGSVKTHVSSDSDSVHDQAQPSALPTLFNHSGTPPTPVLAVRYPSRAILGGNRTSIYVDRTSVGSGTASSVVFARGWMEDGSTGRISRDEFVGRSSRDELAGRASRDELFLSSERGTSETATTEGHGRTHRVAGSKALRVLGIGPSSPLSSPPYAHTRSRSQPSMTYGLPSLLLSPRARAPREIMQPPSEVSSGARVYSPSAWTGSRAHLNDLVKSTRIHSHRPSASLSHHSPISVPPVQTPSTLPTHTPRERHQLSIMIPPRLGAPILPVAELAAVRSPSPQQSTRANGTPRGHGISHTPGLASAGQLSDLGVLERTLTAFGRPRGASDGEPSPQTRERILRLLGRLPEDVMPDGVGSDGLKTEGTQGGERTPKTQGADRAREVRRTRSESGLLSAFAERSSDA